MDNTITDNKQSGSEKFGKNKWLVSDEFISKMNFHDKYYIKELCRKLKRFLEHAPVNVITTWDSKNQRIYFKIGKTIKFNIACDVNVAHRDFITLVYDKINSYYPIYEYNYVEMQDLTDNDIYEIQKQTGQKLSEIVWEKKEVKFFEKGKIIKINMGEKKPDDMIDTFILSITKNEVEEKEIRQCDKKCLKTFLSTLRQMIFDDTDGKIIKEYIQTNSKFIEKKSLYKPPIKINYAGEMMINFFKINKKFVNEPLYIKNNNLCTWGDYEIMFQTDVVKEKCLKLVKVNNI